MRWIVSMPIVSRLRTPNSSHDLLRRLETLDFASARSQRSRPGSCSHLMGAPAFHSLGVLDFFDFLYSICSIYRFNMV